jgi:hypothetical protein
MKPAPIHAVVARIRPLPAAQKIARLRALIATEKPHSIRRGDLEALLRDLITKRLKFENRGRKTA